MQVQVDQIPDVGRISNVERDIARVLEHLVDGVTLLNPNHRLAAFNRKYLKMYDIEPGEIKIGDTIEHICGVLYDKGVIPDLGGRDQTIDQRLEIVGRRNGNQERRELPNGLVVDLFQAELADGSHLSIHVDVTRNVRSEEQLARQKAYLETILQNLSDGVVLLDPDGRFIAYNEKYLQLYMIDPRTVWWGMSFSEMADNFGDLTDLSEDRRQAEIERRRAFSIDPTFGRVKRRLQDGRMLDINKSTLPEGGCVLTIRDITDVLQREQELVVARDRAEESNRLKSESLARISHELRTPLNGVMGMMSLLGQTGLDERQRSYLDVSMASGDVLLRLIDDMLDLTRMEADTFTLKQEPFNLRRILGACVAMIEPQAVEKGLRLERNLNIAGAPMLLGDPVRCKQIVLNLLTNAVKFTQEGFVRVSVSGFRAGDLYQCKMVVRDSGIGIPDGKLGSIFAQYYQVNDPCARDRSGAGLGLSIVERLVEAMEGSIQVQSTHGAGSEFSVHLALPVAP